MQLLERFERNTTITKKGQVTIPVEIRRALGVGPHDQVAFVRIPGIKRVEPSSAATGAQRRIGLAGTPLLRRYGRAPGTSAVG